MQNLVEKWNGTSNNEFYGQFGFELMAHELLHQWYGAAMRLMAGHLANEGFCNILYRT